MPTDVAAGRESMVVSPDGHYRWDNPWELVATTPSSGSGTPDQTLFAIGNGFVGVRGAILGDRNTPTNVAIVNGFYEGWTIQYPEVAYGFATAGQTLLTAPSPTEVLLVIEDETFDLASADVSDYNRTLDMRHAVYRESLIWTLSGGARFRLATERFASFSVATTVGVRVSVEALNEVADVSISFITTDGRQSDVGGDPDDPRRSRNLPEGSVVPVLSEAIDNGWASCIRTATSKMQLALASRFAPADVRVTGDESGASSTARCTRHLEAGERVVVERLAAYQLGDSSDRADELVSQAERSLDDATYDSAFTAHQAAVAALWARCDIEIDCSAAEQQGVRFALFQLLQAGAMTEAGISAKGVSSNGYEGHYFWDTEMFIVPFWHSVDPARARHLLQVRYQQLPIARQWASRLKHQGALFAWRTINGHEASAYFPAGTAQIHLNADIAMAVSRFISDFPDDEFVLDGVELLVETARFFAGYGFVGADDRFHLHCVTGPDEYTALVDDNYFTNRMAQANLRAAAAAISRLTLAQHSEIAARTNLNKTEAARWLDLGDRMYLGLSTELEIRPQDNSFLSKERWDFSDGGPMRPLLLDQHPTTIYRHQVLKQSDVVLADFVFAADEDPKLIRRNFDYYEELTTGDSSLSAGIQAAVAASLGLDDIAKHHFQHALWTDLDNLHNNTADGIHVATAGSIWLCIVRGFVGLRSEDRLSIQPSLPLDWKSISVPYDWRGHPLRILVTHDAVTIVNEGDTVIDADVYGQTMTIPPNCDTRIAKP